eukprot:1798628-Heterocapsa_arctica.AAC.1
MCKELLLGTAISLERAPRAKPYKAIGAIPHPLHYKRNFDGTCNLLRRIPLGLCPIRQLGQSHILL